MAGRLTDSAIKAFKAPAAGNRIYYDADVKGFGVRVTAAGARAFILNYRTKSGRERRYTIGQFPAWKVAAARQEASDLRKMVDRGGDPLGDSQTKRDAPTVVDLCNRYEEEHLPKKREVSQRDDRSMIRNDVLPT